jgi:RNA polymerase sigma factor (sigma-70 family)
MKKTFYLQKHFVLLSPEELVQHIEGCRNNSRESQKKIYHAFYGYAMSVCHRYASAEDDAVEMMNDGFLKIFREIGHFTPSYADTAGSFTGWLRRIMVNTAIDHFRKHHKKAMATTSLHEGVINLPAHTAGPIEKITHDEIIRCIQQLSPGYRTVFNLFVIEGLTHEEISRKLGISEGTSKSNLSKARQGLQKILFNKYQSELVRNAV